MGLVKLSAKLPDDHDLNGLDHHISDFKTNPREQWVAIVYLGVQKTVTDYEKGEISPVLMVDAAEIIARAENLPDYLTGAFNAAKDRRTNSQPLWDPETGAPNNEDDIDTEQLSLEPPRVDEVIDAEIIEGGEEQ